MNDIFAVTFIISCWLFLLLLISMLRNITNLNFCMIKRLKNVWQLFYHIRRFLQFWISALKSVTNYLLVNLSVADLLITWLCIPMQVIKTHNQFFFSNWSLFLTFSLTVFMMFLKMTVLSLGWFPFGKAVCHIVRSGDLRWYRGICRQL